jgi:hypothetical protein
MPVGYQEPSLCRARFNPPKYQRRLAHPVYKQKQERLTGAEKKPDRPI